jgi:photosystem II stability/assembly factor-like uncharacterized protein
VSVGVTAVAVSNGAATFTTDASHGLTVGGVGSLALSGNVTPTGQFVVTATDRTHFTLVGLFFDAAVGRSSSPRLRRTSPSSWTKMLWLAVTAMVPPTT